MITMTKDQLQKIDLLDALFSSLSVEQLKELTEQECVAAKLRGDNTNMGILKDMLRTNEYHAVELMNLKSQSIMMRDDFQCLLKILNATLTEYNNDFYNLKQRHNIY